MTTEKKVSPICPLCEQGVLSEQETSELTVYKSVERILPLYFASCSECGTEQADAKHVRANKRALQAFKKEVDGLLTGEQVRELRESLCLTQTQAAQMFGGGPVAFSKYESDDVAQSESMNKLLRLASAMPAALTWLKQDAGFDVTEAVQRSAAFTVHTATRFMRQRGVRQDFSDFESTALISQQVEIGAQSVSSAASNAWIH